MLTRERHDHSTDDEDAVNIFGGKGCDLNGVTQRVDGRGDCPKGLTAQEVDRKSVV